MGGEWPISFKFIYVTSYFSTLAPASYHVEKLLIVDRVQTYFILQRLKNHVTQLLLALMGICLLFNATNHVSELLMSDRLDVILYENN